MTQIMRVEKHVAEGHFRGIDYVIQCPHCQLTESVLSWEWPHFETWTSPIIRNHQDASDFQYCCAQCRAQGRHNEPTRY